MSTHPSPRKPRSWLDALIATTLRWNDRLGREVVSTAAAQSPAGTAASGGQSGRAAPMAPMPPPSRGR